MALKQRFWTTGCQAYSGLTMRCAPGTHEAASRILAKYISPTDRVLELGVGSGAFLARLRDMGFEHLEGADICLDQCEISNVPLQECNFDQPFQQLFPGNYSAIVVLEVIEHLESPRNFIRQVRELLSEDGYLIISTPNIAHWIGRLHFLCTGEVRYFSDEMYHSQRHITILPDNQFKLLLSEVGLRTIEAQTVGTFLTPLVQSLIYPFTWFARLLFGANSDGDVSIYFAQHAEQTISTPGRSPYYAKWYSSQQVKSICE